MRAPRRASVVHVRYCTYVHMYYYGIYAYDFMRARLRVSLSDDGAGFIRVVYTERVPGAAEFVCGMPFVVNVNPYAWERSTAAAPQSCVRVLSTQQRHTTQQALSLNFSSMHARREQPNNTKAETKATPPHYIYYNYI